MSDDISLLVLDENSISDPVIQCITDSIGTKYKKHGPEKKAYVPIEALSLISTGITDNVCR
jgi:hypothetical protein